MGDAHEFLVAYCNVRIPIIVDGRHVIEEELTGMVSVDALFQPLRIGTTTLRNRLAMAPMTRCFAQDEVHDPRAVEYYGRRARGGIGLIISEGSPPPTPEAPFHPNVPGFGSQAALAKWKEIADAVNAAGSQMLVQLWHAGILRDATSSAHPEVPPLGPSGVFPVTRPDNPDIVETQMIGREMTLADIERTIDLFASTAQTCQDLGFSGIELHAAHGYLFDQFFWEESNRRTDKYGGDLAQRTQFAVETVQEIRRRTGPDFLISLRFSQFKPPLYSAKLAHTPKELEQFLEPLASSGLDLIHASTRRFWIPEFEGSDLTLAAWTKKITGLPTISVGSVCLDVAFDPRKGAGAAAGKADLRDLTRMMERGDFDIIAIGRSLLANPEWATIVREHGSEGLVSFDKTALDELV